MKKITVLILVSISISFAYIYDEKNYPLKENLNDIHLEGDNLFVAEPDEVYKNELEALGVRFTPRVIFNNGKNKVLIEAIRKDKYRPRKISVGYYRNSESMSSRNIDWEEYRLYDDGTHGDENANDGVFSFMLKPKKYKFFFYKQGRRVNYILVKWRKYGISSQISARILVLSEKYKKFRKVLFSNEKVQICKYFICLHHQDGQDHYYLKEKDRIYWKNSYNSVLRTYLYLYDQYDFLITTGAQYCKATSPGGTHAQIRNPIKNIDTGRPDGFNRPDWPTPNERLLGIVTVDKTGQPSSYLH